MTLPEAGGPSPAAFATGGRTFKIGAFDQDWDRWGGDFCNSGCTFGVCEPPPLQFNDDRCGRGGTLPAVFVTGGRTL